MKKISIEIFSDVLCIWAYGAQVRFDQIRADYGERVELIHRFIPVFAAAHRRIEAGWKDQGGYAAFNRHLQEVAAGWDHVTLHPEVWLHEPPESSLPAHLYLKALQLLEGKGALAVPPLVDGQGRCPSEEYAWRLRYAFFAEARNIAARATLDALAQDMRLPLEDIHEMIDCGAAHAALHQDLEARDEYMVPGSPTLVFNEGRQRLYGNIGYRIIDANIRELLHDRQYGEASWC
ncbi:MAG TPA: disulfide bond formation protein DsbA [Gammaproteobacteria bacterium]|nr:disulfide bond formation protein DsbA [Gammaproteobacteria bacterium]